MFHRTICLTYKPGTAQADADGLLAAFAVLPSQVRGLKSASVIAPQEGFDACVDLAFATWQAREDCALDEFYQAALSWAKELSASLESRDSSDGEPAPDAGMPLRWHKFLVYFALWAEALLLMVEGLRMLSRNNTALGLSPAADALALMNAFTSLCMFGIAFLQLFACWELAHFRRNGPRLLLWANVAPLAYCLVALAALWLIVGEVMPGNVFIAMFAQLLLAVCNRAYYRRRAAMFVN